MIIPSRCCRHFVSAYCEGICQRNVMCKNYAKQLGRIVTKACSLQVWLGFAACIIRCRLHRIAGFKDQMGFMDKTDPYIKYTLPFIISIPNELHL